LAALFRSPRLEAALVGQKLGARPTADAARSGGCWGIGLGVCPYGQGLYALDAGNVRGCFAGGTSRQVVAAGVPLLRLWLLTCRRGPAFIVIHRIAARPGTRRLPLCDLDGFLVIRIPLA